MRGSAIAASSAACLSVWWAGLVANKQRSTPGPRWNKELDAEAVSRATREYLATLDDAAFGAASDVAPKFVSPSDSAAQWTEAMRGPAFFAYSDNYLIDVKFGIIMDVEASRAIRQAEVGAAKTMIERTEQRFDIKPERLAGDTAYGSGANLDWLVNEAKIAPKCWKCVMRHRTAGCKNKHHDDWNPPIEPYDRCDRQRLRRH